MEGMWLKAVYEYVGPYVGKKKTTKMAMTEWSGGPYDAVLYSLGLRSSTLHVYGLPFEKEVTSSHKDV